MSLKKQLYIYIYIAWSWKFLEFSCPELFKNIFSPLKIARNYATKYDQNNSGIYGK